MINDIGGHYEQFTSKVYDAWMQEWTPAKHVEKIK